MTDKESEAVAKALDLKIGSLFQGDTRVLIVKELSDAAIAALDAHRATVPDAVRELTEAIRLTPTPGSHEHHWTYDGSRQVCRGCGDQRDAFPTPEPTVKPDATHARAFIGWLASMDDPEIAERLRQIAESVRMDWDSPSVAATLEEAAATLDAHRATVPHVITTVEELEALPERTVLLDSEGCVLQVVEFDCPDHGEGDYCVWDGCTGRQRWYNGIDSRSGSEVVYLPATVLTPTPEPTVKPDREAVRAILIDDDCWDDGFGAPFLLEDVAIDRVLALWPGRTERAVAEAAWDYASGEFENWYNSPFKDREPPENPYRAKGATND